MSFDCFRISIPNAPFLKICCRFLCTSYRPNLPNLNFMSAKPSAFRYLTRLPSHPPLHLPILHVSETHSIQPLHSPTSSFTCSQIYFSLSLFPGQPTSLPPSRLSLCCSPCSVTVSSHSINQACEARAQCSTASHSSTLVPSVPVSLPHSLSHFKKVWVARYSLFFPPPLLPHCRSGDGRDGAGVENQLSARFHIT